MATIKIPCGFRRGDRDAFPAVVLNRHGLWRRFDVGRADRRLAVATGNIEDIGRLAKAGDPTAQRPHQVLAGGQRCAKMAGSRRQVAVVEVVGLHPVLDEGPHQLPEGFGVVVDAGEQHRLADQRDAGVGEAGDGGAGRRGEFAGMIRVYRHPSGDARRRQRGDQRVRHPFRRDHRDAGVEAHDPYVVDVRKGLNQLGNSPRRGDQRVAAGDDHLPDLRMGPDIIDSVFKGLRFQVRRLRADHLAAEAESAVDRTDMDEFQQHPVRVTVDKPF